VLHYKLDSYMYVFLNKLRTCQFMESHNGFMD